MEISEDELLQINQIKFNSQFEPICELACGAFGTVIKARNVINNKIVAVKEVSNDKPKALSQFKNEVQTLEKAHHQNIIKMYNFFETQTTNYIVMEYIHDCTLQELIDQRKGKFTEDEVREIMDNLLQSIEHLHKLNICHRDIKPQNIMFDDRNDFSSLKLIDFGLSAELNSETEREFCGTLMYMAPERIKGNVYSKEVDIWSAGIIMYTLLNNGKHPLYSKGDKREQYLQKLKEFQFRPITKISKCACDFLRNLLAIDPHFRYTVDLALHDTWIREFDSKECINNSFDNNHNKKDEWKGKQLLLAMVFLKMYAKNCLIKANDFLIYSSRNKSRTTIDCDRKNRKNYLNSLEILNYENEVLFTDNFRRNKTKSFSKGNLLSNSRSYFNTSGNISTNGNSYVKKVLTPKGIHPVRFMLNLTTKERMNSCGSIKREKNKINATDIPKQKKQKLSLFAGKKEKNNDTIKKKKSFNITSSLHLPQIITTKV